MNAIDRDQLGKCVRDAWIKWAQTQPNPKPSWLVDYDRLEEHEREVDRQIAEAVLEFAEFWRKNSRRLFLIELKFDYAGIWREEDEAELTKLQEECSDYLMKRFPHDHKNRDAVISFQRKLEGTK